MKVLIIEDDIPLNTAVTEFFTLKAFETVSVTDGLEALKEIEKQHFELYIIDINLPEISGLEILKHIRKTDVETPIIIITASLEIENFTTAFDNGCSEYIKKPFHLKELDIRVSKLLSACSPRTVSITKTLSYDLNTEDFIYKQQKISLRYKEKRFCSLLMNNLGHYVSFETIYDYVWEGEIKENYPLRQLIAGLRKKLPYDIIETKIKVGYQINSLAT